MLGTGGALALSQLLTALLYEVEPDDPATLVSAGLCRLGAAARAAYLPAQRAMRVDPLEVLRAE